MGLGVNSRSQNQEIEEVRTMQSPKFDVVADDSDHHYRNTKRSNKDNGGDCFTSTSSWVHKKIMKEWKVLEQNLPESIHVRVYESRIDLLRAVIIGPAGTPYHDGLFFFDLAFPPDYPTQPPQIYYSSFGLRLNPNLYTNGRVCLSLLNTWVGNRNERWNPSESTVLQVLISIQGLVLNEQPYFNEPGTRVSKGQDKKSIAYNENVFILSCKTMIYLLRKPPKNFEDFVASHFRDRAHHILTACNAYMDSRAVVGRYTGNGSISSSSSISVSNNFKVMMKSWYPEMVLAFSRTGASLGDFVEQLRVEKEMASSEQGRIKKKKKKKTATFRPLVIKKTKCGVRKVIGEIKKILGLKKDGKNRSKAKSS